MKKYDVIMVGMGPSNVFCAYELIELKKHQNILLIEQGKDITKRCCPIEKLGKCAKCKPFCNITCGFSGAGAFSDGKLLSYHLSNYNAKHDMYLGGNGGGYINKYMSNDQIKSILTYTDNIYLKFGADKELYGLEHVDEIKKLQHKAEKENLKLVDIPLRHLGTEKAHVLYGKLQNHLQQNNVELMFNTEVLDLIIQDGEIKGVVVKNCDNGKEGEIFANNIVLGVGRKGAAWLSDLCEKHQIATTVGSVDIGIRYELPNSVMKDINKYLYEGKFLGKPEPFRDKVRTFCQNPSGFVSAEVYDNDLTLVNGHSYKDRKSENTNLAILVSHHFTTPFNKPIEYGVNVAENINRLADKNVMVQRLGDIYRGRRTWPKDIENNPVQPTLKSAVPGDITYCLGYRTTTDILEFIKTVDKVVEGFADPHNLLYAPEIKFYSNNVVLNNDFETNIHNLYSIGDGGGLTTGLMMASASGVQMARILNKRIN